MENATKALLIAAGIFFAIMILSLLVSMYNQISSHYQQEHDLIEIEQLEKFNKQFENYNREGLRGNELISFMNKIIDYNASQSYDASIGYERIRVTIDLHGLVDEFKFPLEDGSKYGNRNALIRNPITNATGGGTNYSNDRQLVAITGTPTAMIEMAETAGFDNMTDTQLQQLQSKIGSIIIDETRIDNPSFISNRYYRAQILQDLLGWEVQANQEDWITKSSDAGKMETIKDITNQYYQYTKFKRALFDCTEVEYDSETNRIVRMDFEVQTEVNDDDILLIVFD